MQHAGLVDALGLRWELPEGTEKVRLPLYPALHLLQWVKHSPCNSEYTLIPLQGGSRGFNRKLARRLPLKGTRRHVFQAEGVRTGLPRLGLWRGGLLDERPQEARRPGPDGALPAGADDVGLRRQHSAGDGMAAQCAAQRSAQPQLHRAGDVDDSGERLHAFCLKPLACALTASPAQWAMAMSDTLGRHRVSCYSDLIFLCTLSGLVYTQRTK